MMVAMREDVIALPDARAAFDATMRSLERDKQSGL